MKLQRYAFLIISNNKNMSFPYKKRNPRYCFDPNSKERFRVSRSKIDLFIECQRCFFLDVRHGLPRTSLPSFSLNNAVDLLLKKDFDKHREKGTWHPTLKQLDLKLKPFAHKEMDAWRDALRAGVQYDLPDTTLTIRGGVDDIWVDKDGLLYVVDYKATAKADDSDVNIEGFWQQAYKRQVEVYQWLLRKNGFEVSNTAYFYYVNGKLDEEGFAGSLKFTVKVIPYEGNDSWVDEIVYKLYECLQSSTVPESSEDCEHCGYIAAVRDVVDSGHEDTEVKPIAKTKSPESSLF